MIIVFWIFALLAAADAAWHIKHDAPPPPQSQEWCDPNHPPISHVLPSCDTVPAQSWDQANLKQNDNTCRTMVYHVDPETGLLVQCPPEAQ